MNAIKHIWQLAAPDFLLGFVRFILEPGNYKLRRKAVLRYYRDVDIKTLPPEIREGLKYLRFHKYTPLPYKWTGKYDNILPEIFRDKTHQCYFIMFEGKKMYFPKSFDSSGVTWAVRAIMREQDPRSPHLYLNGDFQVEEGSIVIDAGVAEGNFALSVVEKAKRLYLVECDSGWMGALRLTFEPWKEKVVFVEKYMSDTEGAATTSIDALSSLEEKESFFIKLDIEGYEQKALAGMKRLIESGNPVRMDVCTYHHPGDFKEILATLKSYNFRCQASEGYLLYFQPGEEPSFRQVLIRAERP